TTAPIDFGATAADIKLALESLSNIDLVQVNGAGTASNPWRVAFLSAHGQNVPQIIADASGLESSDGAPAQVTLATTFEGGRLAGLKADRDLLAAKARLNGYGLSGASTNADIAVALADPVLLASLKADRDLVAGDAPFVAATARLLAAGLSGDSTDSQIAAAFGNSGDIGTAKRYRDLLQQPAPAADDALAKFQWELARNFLAARNLVDLS